MYDTATGAPWQSFCDRAKRRPARKCAAIAPDRSPHPRTLAKTKITIRGDGHYGRREVMDWCEDNDLDYVFGLSGNRILAPAVEDNADDIRTRRALKQMLVLRGYAQTDYAAKSWRAERRVCARIEATELGLDIRYVVTNIATGSAEHIYDTLYCARGQMEKSDQIAQEPTGVGPHVLPAPLANQMRLILHTAAYWLMLELRDAIPKNPSARRRRICNLARKSFSDRARIIETASPHQACARHRLSSGWTIPISGRRLTASGA